MCIRDSILEYAKATIPGFDFDLPFSFLDAQVEFVAHNATMRVTMHEDGTFSGMLGGGRCSSAGADFRNVIGPENSLRARSARSGSAPGSKS